MKMLHYMSLAFIAVAVVLIAIAFFTFVGRVQNAPSTGLFTAQNQVSGITGQALAGQGDSQKNAECIADPRKCFGQTEQNP
ncbi:MAG: hypothetical protein V1717_01555 [Candidatus Micrarchaeota archaeon]